MTKDIFTVGPVLSCRGIGAGGKWQVTALIGLAKDAEPPVLRVDGQSFWGT